MNEPRFQNNHRSNILSILPIHVNNGPHSKASYQHPPRTKTALTLRD